MDIRLANERDAEQIISIDKEVIGSDRRKEEIVQAIKEERCLIVLQDSESAGFLIYHQYFFDCSFISLLMIRPSQQRQGLASSLLKHMAKIAPTEKLFSSTNQSNTAMQKVFEANGFTKSGIIDNLDDGDLEIVYFIKKKWRR
jgi:ribosomal protein S18 acetylase RimI-like enzyme